MPSIFRVLGIRLRFISASDIHFRLNGAYRFGPLLTAYYGVYRVVKKRERDWFLIKWRRFHGRRLAWLIQRVSIMSLVGFVGDVAFE